MIVPIVNSAMTSRHITYSHVSSGTNVEDHKSRIRKDGPGLWFLIHKLAYELGDINKDKVCSDIRVILAYIPCGECREHASKYIQAHPPEKSMNLFEWTVDFHNKANERLGKKVYTYREASDLYDENSICQQGCDESSPVTLVPTSETRDIWKELGNGR